MGLLTLYFDITEELFDDLNAENIAVTFGKERFKNCKFEYSDFILSTTVDVKNDQFDTIRIDRESHIERNSQSNIEVAAIFVAKNSQHWRKFVPKEQNGMPYYSEVFTYELEFVTAASQNPSRAKALGMALYSSSGDPSNLIHLGQDVELISSRQLEQRYLVEVSKPSEIEYIKLFVDDLESHDWLLDHIIVHKIAMNNFDQRKTYHKTFRYQPRYVRSKPGQQVITIYEDVVSSSSTITPNPDYEPLPIVESKKKKKSKKKTKKVIRNDSFSSFSTLNTERDYTFVDLAKIRSSKSRGDAISTDDISVINLDPSYVSEAGDPPSYTSSVYSEASEVLPILKAPPRNVRTNFSTIVLPTSFTKSGCQVSYQLSLRTGSNNQEVFLNRLYVRVLGDEGCTRRILLPLSTSTCFGKNSTANLSFHGKDVGNITGYELWTRTQEHYSKLDFEIVRIQRQSQVENRFERRNVSYSKQKLHKGVFEGTYDHSDLRSEYSLAWSEAQIQRSRFRQVSSSSSSSSSSSPSSSSSSESEAPMKITTIAEREVYAKPLQEFDTSFTFTQPKSSKFNWRGLEVPKDNSNRETFPILIVVQNFNDFKQNIELYMIDKQNKKSKTYKVPVSKSACYRIHAQDKRLDQVKLACVQPEMAEYIPCMQIDDQLFIRRFKSASTMPNSMPALYAPGTIYRVQASNTESMRQISKDRTLETENGSLRFWKNDTAARRAYFFGPAGSAEHDKIFLRSEFDNTIGLRSFRTCSSVDSSGKMRWGEEIEIMRVAGTNNTYKRKIMARYKISIAFSDSDPYRRAILKFYGTDYTFNYDLSEHHKENCLIEIDHLNVGFIHKVDIQTSVNGIPETKPSTTIDYIFIQCDNQPGQFLTCPNETYDSLTLGYMFKVDFKAKKAYEGRILNIKLVGQDGSNRSYIYPGNAFSKGETNIIFGGASQFRELILTGDQGRTFPECFEEILVSQAKTITYESEEGHEPDYKVVEVFNDLFNMKKGYADRTKTFLNLSGIQV